MEVAKLYTYVMDSLYLDNRSNLVTFQEVIHLYLPVEEVGNYKLPLFKTEKEAKDALVQAKGQQAVRRNKRGIKVVFEDLKPLSKNKFTK